MKKIIGMIIVIIGVLILTMSGCKEISSSDIIRIHIRANSNSELDQQVKYLIKDKIVDYINPLSNGLESKQEMYSLLKENLAKLQEIADSVLTNKGYDYQSKVSLREEEFPIRTYDGVTLPAGIYDALIIELGKGTGDNWWCVAFPPLCFIGATDNGEEYFVYKSKLLELLSKG